MKKDILNKSIIEFENTDLVEGFYLLKNLQAKDNKNAKKYLDLDLSDKTGNINGKYWNVQPEELELYTPGSVVKIRGEITSFDNKLQLKVTKIRNIEEGDQIKIEDFVPKAPEDGSEMYKFIMKYIENMEDQDIKNICRDIYEEKEKELSFYPAAQKNHHSIYGGLLYHISTMLKTAEALSGIYTFINTDILYAGVLLHDIAKIDEMDSNDLGVVKEYTFEGQMLGHIIQGIKLVNEKGKKFNVSQEKVVVLEHMILSHHNEPEYGSPKRPMIPEAELLCHIDMMDARMYDMSKALENLEKGSFTEKIWLLNNRKLYKY